MHGAAAGAGAGRRLLLVHAHPDDETIQNGATMARYAAEGARVTLVTCTRGEQGEVIPAGLAHLEGDGEALAAVRERELAAAMDALRVTDHRFLGADAGARLRDSGMVYDEQGHAVAPPDMRADAFAHVPVDEAAAYLVPVVREVRPQVVVTYDPGGGYGHPDHVHAHRVATRAVELAADPAHGAGEPWSVDRLFWTVTPVSRLRAALRELAGAGLSTVDPDGPMPSVAVPDEEVTTVVDATRFVAAKAEALRAHATQVVLGPGAAPSSFALSNGLHQPLSGVESYRMVLPSGAPAPATDLFADLA